MDSGFLPTHDERSVVSQTRSGVLVDGTAWFWQTPPSTAVITRAHRLESWHRIVMMIGFVLFLFGLGVFVLGVLVTFRDDVILARTWTTASFPLAGLWGTIFIACFLAYWRKQSDRHVSPVPRPRSMPERVSISPDDHGVDLETISSDEARTLISGAFSVAANARQAEVRPAHFVLAALSGIPARTLCARLGIGANDLRDLASRVAAKAVEGETVFGSAADDVLARAFMLALADRRRNLGVLEILEAAFAAEPVFADFFLEHNIKPEELENTFAWLRISEDLRERYHASRSAAAFKPRGNMDRAYTAVATPFLDKVSEDLTVAAASGRTSLLIGREKEMNEILRSIEGGNQSVVLVGQAGVGKAAIIDGLALRMAEEDVPKIIADKRLLRLSVPHIVSAQGGTGASERFLYALQEVGHSGNIILVIENIHELVGAANQSIDLSSILAGELERGYTFVIGTTTTEGARLLERSPLGPRLAKIPVTEPERNDAIRMLQSKIGYLEAKHRVVFTYHAVAALVDLSDRYLHEENLPEKAIILAKEVALEAGKRATAKSVVWIERADVAALISQKSGVPTTEVTQSEGDKLLNLEQELHTRVIGQDEAVRAVAAALRRSRAELRSTKRPIANFLFLGPTGVGKTELAKTTARIMFPARGGSAFGGGDQQLLRFDMSEYQEQSSMTRLIGGNRQSGLMTEAIRHQPYAILLLDEIEKAHPDILNLFLQLLDEGRLTDGTGRTIDCTNLIVIATSNAGTTYIQDAVARGETIPQIKTTLLETELRSSFRPEFLNRFDDVIVFSPLSPEDVVAIAYLMIGEVTNRLAQKSINLVVDDAAINELAQLGFDLKFGARPLRRVIQDKVENVIADYLLRGNVNRRDTIVLKAGGEIEVQKAAAI